MDKSAVLRALAGRVTSEGIRTQIPSWLTDDEVLRLWRGFEPPEGTLEEFTKVVRTSKNWVRISKSGLIQYFASASRRNPRQRYAWQRIYDCKPFDDQLRLYVTTDKDDEKITNHEFMTE